MKKNIILLMTAVFGVFVLAGCSEDDLNKTSAVLDSPTVENDFDRWLAKNYMEPYNIDFKYRFKDGRHGLQPDSRGLRAGDQTGQADTAPDAAGLRRSDGQQAVHQRELPEDRPCYRFTGL